MNKDQRSGSKSARSSKRLTEEDENYSTVITKP